MSIRTLNVELPEAVADRIEKLALETTRTPGRVASDVLERLLELEAWQIDDIRAGLREADAGAFASDAEVAASFARHGA